jgi:hypothetical protein
MLNGIEFMTEKFYLATWSLELGVLNCDSELKITSESLLLLVHAFKQVVCKPGGT